MSSIPLGRITRLNDAPLAPARDLVLYWQIMARRTRFNFALEHAVDLARTIGKPLVVLEPLRAGYHWAADRHHRFAMDAMADTARAYAAAGVTHIAYVEPPLGAGRGLLEALARHAAVVITDDYPEFFIPRMTAAAAAKLAAIGVRLEAVDGIGVLPMRATDKAHAFAHQFRRHVQRVAAEHLAHVPAAEPLRAARTLAKLSPAAKRAIADIHARWPSAPHDCDALPIDHTVAPVEQRGGERAARALLRRFITRRYDSYAERRNNVNEPGSSELSPYLHWGFLSPHEVFAAIAERERWTPEKLALRPTGSRDGWWGMSANGDALLDQLVTWRELGFNGALFIEGHDRFESLPAWARESLLLHDADTRVGNFTLEMLEAGETYDTLWNATQAQLRAEGRIHNYLRMLWGKKILEWAPSPRDALAWMLHLNDKWALDGRDPNSTSGITWVMGRYDRPWGPERRVIGKLRPMTSENTARKMRVTNYIARYAGATARSDARALRGG